MTESKKYKLNNVIVHNRWKVRKRSRNENWVIIGLMKSCLNHNEYCYKLCFIGLELQLWFDNYPIRTSSNCPCPPLTQKKLKACDYLNDPQFWKDYCSFDGEPLELLLSHVKGIRFEKNNLIVIQSTEIETAKGFIDGFLKEFYG